MTPSRPFKCIKDVFNDDLQKMFSMECTLNLFDVENYSEAVNELEGFTDEIKRCIVYLPESRAFIIRISYKDFDKMMLQLKEDYQMLDIRSMTPPDKIKYKGFIKITGAIKPQFMVATFHRKNYQLKGRTEKDFEDFSYNALFNYIYPMN